MITSQAPANWQTLQNEVARILQECGFSVEIEKKIQTVRGDVTIDVHAQESVNNRRYTILFECKHWQARVPQTVIHAFRTVVSDSGANLGYIVSSAGFQSGAFESAAASNIRLVTWEEFQREFLESWIERYLLPLVMEKLRPLLATYTQPPLPRRFSDLTEPNTTHVLALKQKYDVFGWLMLFFTSHSPLPDKRLPTLPLRGQLKGKEVEEHVPASILDAVGYRDFLEAAIPYGTAVIAEFSQTLSEEEWDGVPPGTYQT